MQSVPIEVQSLILHRLDPASLNAAFQVCKNWNHTIQQDAFCQSYAQTRTLLDMNALTQEFFQKFLPYLSPAQLFCIDGKKITRHRVHVIVETDFNQLNLRIVKLLTSLEWYKEILHKYKKSLSLHNEVPTQQLEESLPYNYLFQLVNYRAFVRDDVDKITKEKVEQHNGSDLYKKSELHNSGYNNESLKVRQLCELDYAALRRINANILDDLLQAVFSRHNIIHLVCPMFNGDFFSLSTVFFKNLFTSLTSKYFESPTYKPFQTKAVLLQTPSSNEDVQCMNFKEVNFCQTKYDTKRYQNGLYPEGCIRLQITVNNTEKLVSLSQWIVKTQITIEFLYISLGYVKPKIEALAAFGESLLKSNVKDIAFTHYFGDRQVIDLIFKLQQSLRLKSNN